MRYPITRDTCEYIRSQAKAKFEYVKQDWIDYGLWALPHKTRWLLDQEDGRRNSRHVVDPTHRIAQRSYVAGFLEGNTSASRPWVRHIHPDPDVNRFPENRAYLEKLTRKVLNVFAQSNFYDSEGAVYYEYSTFNTACQFIDRIGRRLFYHNLDPGSYFVINNAFGEPVVLVREFELTVKAIMDRYGKLPNSYISKAVRKMYDQGDYTTKIQLCTIVQENERYDANLPAVKLNRPWIALTFEGGISRSNTYYSGMSGVETSEESEREEYINVDAYSLKPFVVAKSQSSNNYEYGETGPTEMAFGLVRSINKKAIGKDLALEQMIKPTYQGPASLNKSYLTNQANSYVPLDPASYAAGGLKKINDINPAIQHLVGDVQDLRNIIERIYYSDFLTFLSRNPKTRTAAEVHAVVRESQLVIGPNLQSLNLSHNVPHVEFVTNFVLETDPEMLQIPEGLQGSSLRTDFISVFAQAQRAADLPAVEQYMQMVATVGALDPRIFDKANLDKLADIYEDRLYLPEGLNRAQPEVDAMRQRQAQAAERQKALQETIPALAGAAKDVGLVKPQQ